MRKSKLLLRKHIHKVTRRNVYESADRERMKDSRALQNADAILALFISVDMPSNAISKCSSVQDMTSNIWKILKKEAIERRTGRHPQLSSARGHQLEVLLEYSGLKDVMFAEKEIYHAFRIVNEWTEALRYYDGNGAAEQCNPFLTGFRNSLQLVVCQVNIGGNFNESTN